MSDFEVRTLVPIAIGLLPFFALLAYPLVRPGVVPLEHLNTRGNFCLLDIAAMRGAFVFFTICGLAKVLTSTRVDAAEIGSAFMLGAFMAPIAGLYVHIIWRRAVRPLP